MPKTPCARKDVHVLSVIIAQDVHISIQPINSVVRTNTTKLERTASLKKMITLKQIPAHTRFKNLTSSFFRIEQATPVKRETLARMLQNYPNKQYIKNGFHQGFHLGFEGPECSTYGKNKSTVINNYDIALEKITHELNLNRIAGPFEYPPFDNFKISPLALRPKSEPNKYRLLHNLSFPYDHTSVNLNIPESHSKVTYESLSTAIKIIQDIPNAFLAKSDLADAFRMIPLHLSLIHI